MRGYNLPRQDHQLGEHGGLREALIQAAVKVLGATGPQKLSIRAVARELGVTSAAPYHYFKNRTDLLFAIRLEGHARLWEALEHAKTGSERFEDKVGAMTRAYLQFTTDEPGYYAAIFLPEMQQFQDHPKFRVANSKTFDVLQALLLENPSITQAVMAETILSIIALLRGIITLRDRNVIDEPWSATKEETMAIKAVLSIIQGMQQSRTTDVQP